MVLLKKNLSFEIMANNKRDVHVVFLGPTGCGKSRLCNFLLGNDKAFQVSASFKSVTKGIQAKWQSVHHKDELIAFKFIAILKV